MFTRRETEVVDPLGLQRVEEALGDGVVRWGRGPTEGSLEACGYGHLQSKEIPREVSRNDKEIIARRMLERIEAGGVDEAT